MEYIYLTIGVISWITMGMCSLWLAKKLQPDREPGPCASSDQWQRYHRERNDAEALIFFSGPLSGIAFILVWLLINSIKLFFHGIKMLFCKNHGSKFNMIVA
ncbi:hypothetical protein HN747_05600 [archaeon]|jgi:hypothetical protein|nr:hypothetical protein [archaeon]